MAGRGGLRVDPWGEMLIRLDERFSRERGVGGATELLSRALIKRVFLQELIDPCRVGGCRVKWCAVESRTYFITPPNPNKATDSIKT